MIPEAGPGIPSGQVRRPPGRAALLAVAAALAGVPACLRAPPLEADLILTNGIVHAVPATEPPAAAIAVRLGRILAVGGEAAVMKHRGPATPVIDLGGATVVPGLADAHLHLPGIGETLLNESTGESLYLDLSPTESEEDAVQRIRTRVRNLEPRAWVLGKGWDEQRWTRKELPDLRLLSDIVPNNPVFLLHAGGHAVWVNKAALDLGGIGPRTPDPPGGRIERERGGGQPTGILFDLAWEPVLRMLPPLTTEERTQAILLALQRLASMGVTSAQSVAAPGRLGLHDLAAPGDDEVQLFRSLAEAGRLPIRVSLLVPGPSEAAEALLSRGPEVGLGDGRLDIRTILLTADGALPGRGAALLAPYADDPATSGRLGLGGEAIASWSVRALRRGVQVAVEANGDAAVRAAADGFAAAIAATPGADARFRIESMALFDPADLRRLARLGAVAAVRPAALATPRAAPAEAQSVGPDREARLHAFGTLLEAGLRLAGGSDAADRPVHPLLGFHAAVTRQNPLGQPPGGWRPEQRLGRREALRMFTLGAAYAGFRDAESGTLEPGKWADFTILSQDILVVPEEQILGTEVLATYVAGREVYRAERAPGPKPPA